MAKAIDRRARFQLASLGAAVGEPSRAAMLVALMGGVALPASELARAAGVALPTASGHLRQLCDAGLLEVRPRGRHRYYALVDAKVAAALAGLVELGLERSNRPRRPEPLAVARSCYSHLAGRIAVAFWRQAVTAAWVEWREPRVRLLPAGSAALARASLLPDGSSGLVGTSCLDWSERLPHVAGPLGVALLDGLLARGWFRRQDGSRALRLTARGERGLEALGVRWR